MVKKAPMASRGQQMESSLVSGRFVTFASINPGRRLEASRVGSFRPKRVTMRLLDLAERVKCLYGLVQ